MDALHAIIQGIIQGITEFLPVSSSGHLALYQHFTGQSGQGSAFFSLMLHMGTLVAIIAVYYEDIWLLIKELIACFRDIFAGRFTFKDPPPVRKMLFMLIIASLPLLLVALVSKWVTHLSGDNDIVVEGICFLITSALLFVACRTKPGKAGVRQMKPQSALAIGVAQGIAVMPGISRSGATIATGMLLGFKREFVVKFSFLLAIPTILGGAIFELIGASNEEVKVSFGPLALGILSAAVFGFLSITLVRKLVLSKRFVYFAWYTLALGAIVILVGIVEHIAAAFSGAPPTAAGSDVSQVTGTVSDIISAVSQVVSDAVAKSAAA